MRVEPTVTIIEHSISKEGIECGTYHAKYWRPIHSEVMTHRVFGRNARSSRAVPNHVLLREPIVEPLYYGSNKSGMQSGDELTGWRRMLARATWLTLAHITRLGVRVLNFAGLHKQWSNRPLEWFGQIDVLITATDFANWFALRDHPAAAPEIRELAQAMKRALSRSTPRLLMPGEWHMPYVSQRDRQVLSIEDQLMLSVARCARISYKPFNGEDNITAERARFRLLLGQTPVHASPAEHQATPDEYVDANSQRWMNPQLHGNLRGWIQYRKTLPNESVPG